MSVAPQTGIHGPAVLDAEGTNDWLKFECEGKPLLPGGDAYTWYTANRFKELCATRLAPFQDAVKAADGVVTVNMKQGLREVEMRASGIPDDLAQSIGKVVSQVSPPLEAGELEYRMQARKNARQRHMRSIGRWRS